MEKILEELLKPIKKVGYQWGSYTHGHLGTDNGKGLLPWYYLKYDNKLGEEIYNKYFAEYEKSKGEENNNFYADYRYFDIDIFESFEEMKDIAKNRVKNIADEIKEIVKLNKDKISIEFNDEENHCRYGYGNTMGMSPVNKELLENIKEYFKLIC